MALGVIAHSLTPAEIRTLRTEFQNVDVEGRGEISPADLQKALNKSDNYTKEEVEKLFEQIDTDQDGTIGGFWRFYFLFLLPPVCCVLCIVEKSLLAQPSTAGFVSGSRAGVD